MKNLLEYSKYSVECKYYMSFKYSFLGQLLGSFLHFFLICQITMEYYYGTAFPAILQVVWNFIVRDFAKDAEDGTHVFEAKYNDSKAPYGHVCCLTYC